MKVRYEVLIEDGYDVEEDIPVFKAIKTYKGERNEDNALSFIADPKNMRKYGVMMLVKYDQEGLQHEWNDDEGEWYPL